MEEFVLYIIVLLNLEFSLKYHSRGNMDCYCMIFVLSKDLGNVNLRHEFVYIYIYEECNIL